SEDRVGFVLSLVDALQKRGVTVWFDQNQLALGDSLRENINTGLAESRFAVLVLSRHSLAKNWPRQEWVAVLTLEESGQKRVLPVIYGVSRHEIAEAFPSNRGQAKRRCCLGTRPSRGRHRLRGETFDERSSRI